MREILFRGRRLDTGEWVEGDLTRYSKTMSYITVDLIENMVYNVDSDTVGQFTGLLDKNGRRVFEGDLVHCVSRTDAADMVVVFEEGEFRMVPCEDYSAHKPGMGHFAIYCFAKEVVSTIHDQTEKEG